MALVPRNGILDHRAPIDFADVTTGIPLASLDILIQQLGRTFIVQDTGNSPVPASFMLLLYYN